MRIVLAAFGIAATLAQAADYRAGPENYRNHLNRLQAGDRLLLAPGDYTRGLPLHGKEGEKDRPIVVEGPESGPPARFLARPGANTVSLVDVRHLVIRNLELDGRHIPVDAVKAEGHSRYAHFVTLENLHIHDHDVSQQNVGISTKCPAFGWVVRGNRIERVGTGMYFGDSDGSDPFVAGVIEGNHVSATLGYNLQIKHQKARPALPEADARHDTVIRHNFFSKAGAAPGAQARPNVLVGHWPLEGAGSEDRYLIHANLFWQNPSEALFQGEGRFALYGNVLSNRMGDAIHIQPHNDVPRWVEVRQNTVLARDQGIVLRTRPGTESHIGIRGNLVFAGHPLGGEATGRNLAGSYDQAGMFLQTPYADLPDFDVSPRMRVGEDESPPGLPDAELDYFGSVRADGFGAVASPAAGPAYARWRAQVGRGD